MTPCETVIVSLPFFSLKPRARISKLISTNDSLEGRENVLTPGSLMESILCLSSLSSTGQARPIIFRALDHILLWHIL